MKTALGQAHAFLVPGSSPEEAPVTLWAGPAAGLPAIVSRGPLHEERLRGCEDAVLFFDEGNPQALAEAMITLMHEAPLRRELALRGRKAVLRHLPDDAARELCAFFESWYTRRGWVVQPEPVAAPSKEKSGDDTPSADS